MKFMCILYKKSYIWKNHSAYYLFARDKGEKERGERKQGGRKGKVVSNVLSSF